MLKQYGALMMLIIFSYQLSAQNNDVDTQNLLWTRYWLKFQVSEKWTSYFDVEERVYMPTFRQHHFLPTLGVNYKLNENFSLTAAILYFELTIPQDPDADFKEVIRELWPQVAINYKHNVNDNLTFLSRIKTERRYRQRESNSYTFRNFRLRMRMGINYKINSNIKAVLVEEILINMRSDEIRTPFDQNRLSAGFSFKISQKFHFDLGYMYWIQQKPNSNNYVNRNIAYFALKHNLKFY